MRRRQVPMAKRQSQIVGARRAGPAACQDCLPRLRGLMRNKANSLGARRAKQSQFPGHWPRHAYASLNTAPRPGESIVRNKANSPGGAPNYSTIPSFQRSIIPCPPAGPSCQTKPISGRWIGREVGCLTGQGHGRRLVAAVVGHPPVGIGWRANGIEGSAIGLRGGSGRHLRYGKGRHHDEKTCGWLGRLSSSVCNRTVPGVCGVRGGCLGSAPESAAGRVRGPVQRQGPGGLEGPAEGPL